jgi:hypothetical protein
MLPIDPTIRPHFLGTAMRFSWEVTARSRRSGGAFQKGCTGQSLGCADRIVVRLCKVLLFNRLLALAESCTFANVAQVAQENPCLLRLMGK